MISRRVIQTLLGIVWFVDGLLQLKPQMFTTAFINQVVVPTGQGQPHWITSIVNWGAAVAAGHIIVWNALFAAVQLLLGLALIFNFRTKSTIIASIGWSLIVWIFGEGFGQIFTGQSLLMTGAPGAVLLYAFVGIAIWPHLNTKSSAWTRRGIRFAQLSLAVVLLFGSALHIQSAYLSPSGLSQAIAIPALANAVAHQGVTYSLVLAIIEFALAFMLVFKYHTRAAVWATIVLSLGFWWIAQSFGQILDPLSTDFNSGLLLSMLGLCSQPEHLWNLQKTAGLQRKQQATAR